MPTKKEREDHLASSVAELFEHQILNGTCARCKDGKIAPCQLYPLFCNAGREEEKPDEE